MTPTQWYSEFLSKRDMTASDGRPLYTYRVTDDEFQALQQVLRSNTNYDYYQHWDACFVLYASEWWRRNYGEGHWAWDPIFRSIRREISQVQQRNALVTKGFDRWKRPINKNSQSHHDFLATVILECGLPLQVLNQEKGHLTELITKSFASLSLIVSTELEPYQAVEEIAEQLRLPVTLKKKGFYVLVAQIVEEAIALKKEFHLGKGSSPTQYLDQHKPAWREAFPIQVDSAAGKQFLDGLLTEVSAIQVPEPKPYRISLTRELAMVANSWKIKTRLLVPDGFYSDEDLLLPPGSLESFSSKISIEVISSAGERRMMGKAFKTQKAGKTGYHFFDVSGNLPLEAAYQTWRLCLTNAEVELPLDLPLPGAAALADDAPWIFVEKDQHFFFKAAASIRTHAFTALVIANKDWERAGDITRNAPFDEQREIYTVNGKCKISCGDQIFSIVTRSENEDESIYILQGRKFHFPTRHLEVYLGLPTLYKITHLTLAKAKCYRNLQIKKTQRDGWQAYASDAIGITGIRLLGSENEVLFSQKIVVLPKDFALSFESTHSTKGKITLQHSAEFAMSVLGEHIKAEIQAKDNGHEIDLLSLRPIPPKNISLSLLNPSGSFTLDMPFPSKGVKFFDQKGQITEASSEFYLDKLHGFRMGFFNSSNHEKTFTMIFQLIDATRNIKLAKALKIAAYYHEIPLINFLNTLKKLFSVSEDLDAKVRITIEQEASITIKRYSSSIKIEVENKSITLKSKDPESWSTTTIQLVRLDEALHQQALQTLTPALEQDTHQGKWHFDPETYGPGKWLLYPGKDSKVMFRPRLGIIGNKENDASEPQELHFFKESASVMKQATRIEKLSILARIMALDYQNANWAEVDWLWKNADHLPLNTFDVWTAFTRSEESLMALFFTRPIELIDRISNEYPILWESFSIQQWLNASHQYHYYIGKLTPQYADEAVKNKLQYIDIQLKLNCLTSILRTGVFHEESMDLKMAANGQLIKRQIGILFHGEQGNQGLVHRHTKERWPEHLSEYLSRLFRQLPADIKDLIPIPQATNGYMKSVLYLPVILATKTVNPTLFPIGDNEVFQIREIQEFDREWFATIYDLIQAYCWMNHPPRQKDNEGELL